LIGQIINISVGSITTEMDKRLRENSPEDENELPPTKEIKLDDFTFCKFQFLTPEFIKSHCSERKNFKN
jgi:hypothetical protein